MSSSRAATRRTITSTYRAGKIEESAAEPHHSKLCHGPLKLPARGVNVSSARTSDKRRNPGLRQHALKLQHALFLRGAECNSPTVMQADQLDFASDAPP